MALTNEDLQSIAGLLQPINERLDHIETHIGGMETRIGSMETRMDKMESEVQSLKAGQLSIRKDIHKLSDRVEDTYNLALDAWGASAENRALIES